MKLLALLPILFLAGCLSQPEPVTEEMGSDGEYQERAIADFE